ncbi:DUF1349 domain-containing protein [Streptomyces sp. OF3]|uniref:DUF1349 domain-containing protein n=1 Tax=Streptomyces alkaliterrae TaxID=2213162 RepID=A0A7W3WJ43_9ACTN|nr:DUF1349 domain-containing protein [Streptomyces alkaliterrae]MBB1253296.1 DUF1349 domain-containing protein [Streptomyces alkaliterrae]
MTSSDSTTSAPPPPAGPEPFDLRDTWRWSGEPAAWSLTGGSLEITAPGHSDLYSLPGSHEVANLPLLQRAVHGDFTAWTRVTVRRGSSFADAGGLALHGAEHWLKVCVERGRDGGWSIVTVVSAPHSDEAAGPALVTPAADLLITRQGRRCAVRVRADATEPWRVVRTFHGPPETRLRLGLFAQAPFSESASATFEPVRLAATALADRR